jgi:hypothetical protein
MHFAQFRMINSDYCLNSINQLMFAVEMCIFFEVQTEFLNTHNI